MESLEFVQIAALAVALLILGIPLGRYMAKVYGVESHVLQKPLGWLETTTYKIGGINPTTYCAN